MTIDQIREVLFWSSTFNIFILIIVNLVYKYFRITIHTHYSRKFTITPGDINSFLFKILSYYKVAIFFFNIIPFIALSIVAKSPFMS